MIQNRLQEVFCSINLSCNHLEPRFPCHLPTKVASSGGLVVQLTGIMVLGDNPME